MMQNCEAVMSDAKGRSGDGGTGNTLLAKINMPQVRTDEQTRYGLHLLEAPRSVS